MKLISMIEFVLQQNKEFTKDKPLHETNWALEFEKFSKLMIRYAEFLKQPLTLGMFVPFDNNGVVFKCAEDNEEYMAKISNVLFEGFSVVRSNLQGSRHLLCLKDPHNVWVGHKSDFEDVWIIYGDTVEGIVERNYTLTPSALKKIGL